jgi:hypothetical protein
MKAVSGLGCEPPQLLYSYTKLHGVTTQKTANLIVTTVRSSNFIQRKIKCNGLKHRVERKQGRQMYVYRTTEGRSCNNYCRGKAISITYSECVFTALVIQYAKRVRRIILVYMGCLFRPRFSTLSHEWQDFRKKKLLDILCVFWFYRFFLTFLILRKIKRDTLINVRRFLCKLPVIFVRF